MFVHAAAVVCAGISVACLDADIEAEPAAPASACVPLQEGSQCSFSSFCQQGFCGGAFDTAFGIIHDLKGKGNLSTRLSAVVLAAAGVLAAAATVQLEQLATTV